MGERTGSRGRGSLEGVPPWVEWLEARRGLGRRARGQIGRGPGRGLWRGDVLREAPTRKLREKRFSWDCRKVTKATLYFCEDDRKSVGIRIYNGHALCLAIYI